MHSQSELKSDNFFSRFSLQKLFQYSSPAISTTLLAPFRLIEIRYQTMGEMKRNGLIKQNYKGYVDCLKSTVKQQKGFFSLFKGNFAKILFVFSGDIFSLTLGAYTKRMIIEMNKDNNSLNLNGINALAHIAGLMAAFGPMLLTYPFDYAYTRLATDKQSAVRNEQKQFNGIYHVIAQTLKNDGIRGLYRGIITSFGGIFAYRASYFLLYELTQTLSSQFQLKSLYARIMMGYLVTLTSGIIAYPINTVRRRMMMRSITQEKYNWSGQCFSYVIKNQGFLSLYRGFPLGLIISLSSAFTMTFVDEMLRVIKPTHH